MSKNKNDVQARKMTKKTLAVDFRMGAPGQNFISLGMTADMKDAPGIGDLFDLIVGAKLDVVLIPKKDVKGQEDMWDEKHEITLKGCTVKSFSTFESHYSWSCSVHKDEFTNKLDLIHARFANKSVKVTLNRTGTAEKEAPKDGSQLELDDHTA